MKMRFLVSAAVAALVVVGCKTPTHVDKGTIEGRIRAFVITAR